MIVKLQTKLGITKYFIGFFLYLIISFIPIFYSNETIREVLFINYFIQILFILYFFIIDKNKVKLLLSPSFITVCYININFILGSWAYNKGLILQTSWIDEYFSMSHLHISTLYFNLTNYLILISYYCSQKLKLLKIKTTKISLLNINRSILIFTAVLLLAVFTRLRIDLSTFGGKGDFSIIPKTIAALILITILSKSENKVRFIFYLLIILFFASFSYHSKREALLLIFPIALLESSRKSFKPKLKYLVTLILIVVFMISLVLIMSILRGYGGFNASTVWEAARYIDDYLMAEDFIPSFLNNLEVSSTFLNSNLAVNYVCKETSLITYGSTIIKFVFIPFPRGILSDKPSSIIDLYTRKFDPDFRAIGGSYPVSLQSELFWNFHFFGIIAVFIIFLIFNYLYRILRARIEDDTIIDHAPFLYGYMILIYLIRGSGFDIFFVYFLLGLLVYFSYKIFAITANYFVKTAAEKNL